MNLITMVPATAKFFEQMRAMRRSSSRTVSPSSRYFRIGVMKITGGGRKHSTADALMLSRSSSPIGTVGRMQAVGNTRRRRTITFGITS